MPLPLSDQELGELYGTNAEIAPEEEQELGRQLPDETTLLTSAAFEEAIEGLKGSEPQNLARFWQRPPSSADGPSVQSITNALNSFIANLHAMVPWQRALVAAGREGKAEKAIWLKLRDHVRKAPSALRGGAGDASRT